MKQTTFWRCFLTEDKSFNGLKHLTEKVTAVASLTHVWVVVDHTIPTPLPAKINKVKDILICVFISHQDFIFCQKHLERAFCYVFFHSHPFNQMFIVNGKSHCCSYTFIDVWLTSLLAKND